MTDPISELEELLLDWEDGTLGPAGVERLRQLLHDDPACRDRYADFLVLGGLLAHAVGGPAPLPAAAQPSTRQTSVEQPATQFETGQLRPAAPSPAVARRQAARPLIAVAVALLAMLTGRWLYLEFSGTGSMSAGSAVAATESRAHGVAVLTRALDVKWGDSPDLKPGDAIPAGRFHMEAGFAQIEFFCGATVIVEGPADLDLKSPVLAQVREGRLRAQVPPAARGFTLQLEDLTVVDLGTEFGLSVTDAGTNVQVFDGEVELHSADLPRRLLTAGQAIQHSGQGFEEASVDTDEYLNIEKLASRTSDRVTEQFARWRQWSTEVRRDPRLIAYYAFDQTDNWQRRLESSLEPRNRDLDGAIVGARPVAGRWPGKNALEFRRPGDRVRVNVAGEWESLTMCCWVRIDSLDRLFNSLFLTDSYNKGEPHWQILDTGQLYFSVRPRELGTQGHADYKALSPPFWNASLSGRWIHLATVYDVPSAAITHYLNGQVLSHHHVPQDKLSSTRIGTASIGNWSLPTRPEAGFAVRNLNGSIDEFAVYAAALTAEEIRTIFDHGTP